MLWYLIYIEDLCARKVVSFLIDKIDFEERFFLGGVFLEKDILMEQNCTQFQTRLSKYDIIYGDNYDTTFYVHVYDFVTPMLITVSFAQHPTLDILMLLISSLR